MSLSKIAKVRRRMALASLRIEQDNIFADVSDGPRAVRHVRRIRMQAG